MHSAKAQRTEKHAKNSQKLFARGVRLERGSLLNADPHTIHMLAVSVHNFKSQASKNAERAHRPQPSAAAFFVDHDRNLQLRLLHVLKQLTNRLSLWDKVSRPHALGNAHRHLFRIA